jgi:hypothetical protein
VSADINDLITRLNERQRMRFALHAARRVQHLMRDPRSVAALDTGERWLRGEATDAELAEAADAAGEAAWAAAGEAAWAAKGEAARTAEWAAAWAAAWAADKDAARAAAAARNAARSADAARDVERAWQLAELDRILTEGGDA